MMLIDVLVVSFACMLVLDGLKKLVTVNPRFSLRVLVDLSAASPWLFAEHARIPPVLELVQKML